MFSSFLESASEVLNGLNEQLDVNNDVDNKMNNVDENNQQQQQNINHNNDDEKQPQQPLYKIVQEFVVLEMKEKDFYSLNAAVSHWESLTLV